MSKYYFLCGCGCGKRSDPLENYMRLQKTQMWVHKDHVGERETTKPLANGYIVKKETF